MAEGMVRDVEDEVVERQSRGMGDGGGKKDGVWKKGLLGNDSLPMTMCQHWKLKNNREAYIWVSVQREALIPE